MGPAEEHPAVRRGPPKARIPLLPGAKTRYEVAPRGSAAPILEMSANIRLTTFLLVSLVFVVTLLADGIPAQAAISHDELAFRWAPVHYQDYDDDNSQADLIAAIDFDG